MEIYGDFGPLRLLYVSAVKAIYRIMSSYFCTKKVSSTDSKELDKHINKLHKAFEATDVLKSLKIYIVLDHLLVR